MSARRIAVFVPVTAAVVLAAGALQSPQAALPPQSPLSRYPGFGHDPVADENRFASEERDRENRIAACMQRQGFQYTPSPSVAAGDSMTASQSYDLAAGDPNEQYIASLSPSDWQRYSLALAGVQDANDPSATPNGGCIQEAYTAVPGVFAAYNALREPYEAMLDHIETDSRVVSAEQRWSACMDSYGYDYASPEAFEAGPDSLTPSTSGSTGNTAAAPDDGGSAAADTSADPATDAAIAEYESAANTDMTCTSQAGLDAAYADATIAQETAFVDQYRAVLDSYQQPSGGEPPPPPPPPSDDPPPNPDPTKPRCCDPPPPPA